MGARNKVCNLYLAVISQANSILMKISRMHNPWYTAVTTAITKISKLNSCTVYQCQVIYLPAPLKKISHLLSHKITIKLLMPFPSTKEFTNFLTEFIYTDSNQSLLPTLKTITSLHNQLNTLKMCCEKHIVIQKLWSSCFFFLRVLKAWLINGELTRLAMHVIRVNV